MTDEQRARCEAYDKLVKKHVAELSEHFDSVHIFVSKDEGDHKGTFRTSLGSGSYYARYGQIKHWTIFEEACTQAGAAAYERDD